MFNQHAKWLKVTRDLAVAPPDRVAELPPELARLAPGPQRVQPPGPGLHRPRRQQEGRDHPRLPAARLEHAPLGRRPLPAQPRLRQRHRRRQAAAARLADDGRGDPALHARRRDLGLGEQRPGRRARRRPRLRRRRPDARDARGRGDLLREHLPDAPGPVRQRRRPDAAADRERASARPVGRRVRRAVHDDAAGRVRLPRLPVADPPADLPADEPRATSTSAATRRRARRRRRSTWSCSTTSTGSTS